MAFVAYAGDDESGTRAIAPFRSLAPPIADMVKPGPYSAMYQPEDPNYRPTAVVRTMFVNAIDQAKAELIFDYVTTSDAAMRVAQLRPLGGAFARVPADATAYAHRSKPMLMNVAAFYDGAADREAKRAWVSAFHRALQPTDDSCYMGFLTDDGQSRIHGASPGPTWDRSAKIKTAYDPTNLFRLNQNITPDGGGGSSRGVRIT